MKQDEVIHVPEISTDPEALLDEMVQFPKIEVREVLACQVSDRESLSLGSARNVVIDDPIHEIKKAAILEHSSKQ